MGLLFKSHKVKRVITVFMNKEHPTYCVITLYIIYCVELNLLLAILIQLFRFFFVCFGTNFVRVIIQENLWVFNVYMVLVPLSGYFMEFVFVMQIFEWSALIFLILSQKNKLIEEILFDLMHPSDLVREYRFLKP